MLNKFSKLLPCLFIFTILSSSHGHATEEKSTESVQTNNTNTTKPKENKKEAQKIAVQKQNENAKILASLFWNRTTSASLLMLDSVLGLTIHEFGHYFALKAIDPSIGGEIHLFTDSNTSNKIYTQKRLANLKQTLIKDSPKDLNLFTLLEENQLLPEKPTHLFTIGNTTIHTDGRGGYFLPDRSIDHLSRSEEIIYSTAGGASSLIFTYFLLALLAAQKKYQESATLKDSLVFGLQHALTPFENISSTKNLSSIQLFFKTAVATKIIWLALHQLFYAFTPAFSDKRNDGDGVVAWYALLGYDRNHDLNNKEAFTFNSIKFLFGALYIVTCVILTKKCFSTILHYKKDGQNEQESPELKEIEAAIQEALQDTSQQEPKLDVKNNSSEKQPAIPTTI